MHDSEKMVQVRIRASQTVYYNQVVEMSRAEYYRLQSLEGIDLDYELDQWLDKEEIDDDSGSIEDGEYEIEDEEEEGDEE